MKNLKELIDAVRPLAQPFGRAGRQSEDVAALIAYIEAMGTPFDALMGQIGAMKSRSEKYESEEKAEGRIDEADKHMRVFCVLKELERLGKAFDQQAWPNTAGLPTSGPNGESKS